MGKGGRTRRTGKGNLNCCAKKKNRRAPPSDTLPTGLREGKKKSIATRAGKKGETVSRLGEKSNRPRYWLLDGKKKLAERTTSTGPRHRTATSEKAIALLQKKTWEGGEGGGACKFKGLC